MYRRVRDHIRINVVNYVALFFVLSLGTAWALEANSVRSEHIKNGQVKSADVRNDGLKGKDIDESTLGGDAAGGDLTGSYPDPQIGNGAVNSAKVLDESLTGADIGAIGGADVSDGTLTGADIDEASLGQVPSALLGGFGKTGTEDGFCDPETTTFVTCASVGPINVPAGAKALMLARVRATTEVDSDFGVGRCRLGTSSVGVIPDTTASFVVDDIDTFDAPGAQNARETHTLPGVSPSLPAGPTNFGIDCNQEVPGAIDYDEAAVSVVLITAN